MNQGWVPALANAFYQWMRRTTGYDRQEVLTFLKFSKKYIEQNDVLKGFLEEGRVPAALEQLNDLKKWNDWVIAIALSL